MSSDKPVRETFIGPAEESEPETQNVANLMRDKDISFYLDVHSIGRDVMYTWGIETDQTTDPTQNFTSAAWDGKRDGNRRNAYQEYIPATRGGPRESWRPTRISDQIFLQGGRVEPGRAGAVRVPRHAGRRDVRHHRHHPGLLLQPLVRAGYRRRPDQPGAVHHARSRAGDPRQSPTGRAASPPTT